MYDVILFGGTTEGRELAEFLSGAGIPSLVCVATEYGERLLEYREPVQVQSGRLERPEIDKLLQTEGPRFVIDATHPYAMQISENLQQACKAKGLRYIRVLRESADSGDCVSFNDMNSLVSWLNQTQGIIFAATGVKEARALTGVTDYASRVFLRILPLPEGVSACIEMGYSINHLICMQGPFSEELNAAMFRHTGARILVTKESGKNGGFPEKYSAAKTCGMTTAILARPAEKNGLLLSEAKAVLLEANQ